MGARLWRTTHGGRQIWVVGSWLGRGKPGFGCWAHGNERCARGRGFGAQNRKPSGGGSAFVNEEQGGLDLDSGRSVEAG